MAPQALQTFVRHLRTAASRDSSGGRTDAQLLACFAASRDEAAFADLVGRYGRLVRTVCRNVLRSEEDAEEAAQATFLLLARGPALLPPTTGPVVAAWLHGVFAYTGRPSAPVATTPRRRVRESRTRNMPAAAPGDPSVEASWRESRDDSR